MSTQPQQQHAAHHAPSTALSVRPLPKLAELHHSPEVAFKNDELKTLLNVEPNVSWLKKHPFIKTGHHYLPIDKVEFLLDKIFQEWKVEVKNVQQLFNAIQVTVRLHYLNPITGVWMYHDGVGSKELQTVSGTGPLKLDFSNVNNGAVEMATPIAKSTAIKDAADHLGKLFGRDLNRKDTVGFSGSYNQEQEQHTTPHTPSATTQQTTVVPPTATNTTTNDDFTL